MRFPWTKQRALFTEEEQHLVHEAIREAEQRTSGEVRVFVEKCCRYVDAIDRAAELFFHLQMEKTEHRNAVLVYVALKDHQFAIFGDEGIYRKAGAAYWYRLVRTMTDSFNRDNYAQGMAACIREIGQALHQYFPSDKSTDRNELPDIIVFGQ